MVEKHIRLTAADKAVLEHVARYKMTTEPVLESSGVLPSASREVVKKRLQRLCKAGYLQSQPLFQQRVYYHLTHRSAKLLGEEVHKEMFLKDDPKVRAYGALLFCTDPQSQCHKQTALEFRTKFPMLWKSGMRLDYYINTSVPGRHRLGYFRVDYVPKSPDWKTLVNYVNSYVADRCEQPAWQDVINQGTFEITIITATKKKALILDQEFGDNENISNEINFQFYVAEDLIPLIAPDPR